MTASQAVWVAILASAIALPRCCGASEFYCGVLQGSGTDSALAALAAADDSVVGKVVFVTFPDGAKDSLPNWHQAFAAAFDPYIQTMSGGRQRLAAATLTRPGGQSHLAWLASQPASHYESLGDTGYIALNREIMGQINSAYGDPWAGVEHVFVIHYRDVFPGPVVGIQTLGCGACVPSGVKGTTQCIISGQLNETAALASAQWIAAHEYGHTLGMLHAAGSDSTGARGVNPGRYSVMRASASDVSLDGLVPYHAIDLAFVNWIAPRLIITDDTLGLRVADIRSANARMYEVRIPGTNPMQSFFLANHQVGSSIYDAKYETSGLYIWHGLRNGTELYPRVALDLESGDGKFVRVGSCSSSPSYTTPDPISGKDRLEECVSHRGLATDGFDGIARTAVACGTNPSTRAYESSDYSTPQSVAKSIAFENIRRETGTSNMLVDVYLTPKQRVVAPNGGEEFGHIGGVWVSWNPRTLACITNVSVVLLRNGGASVDTLASSTPNDGTFVWDPTPEDVGGDYKIRLVSRDLAGGLGIDDSDGAFSVIDDSCPPWQYPCDGDPSRPDFGVVVTSGTVCEGGTVRVRYALRRNGIGRLKLFDVQGRHVAERSLPWTRKGSWHLVSWRPEGLGAWGLECMSLASLTQARPFPRRRSF